MERYGSYAPFLCVKADESYAKLGIKGTGKDLGSRALLEKAPALYWYPSEVDVSIRPGWFYHAEQDNQVKSLAHLTDIYFKSVGYNSVLLLNIPPDRRGLIHENDANRIKELASYVKKHLPTIRWKRGMLHGQPKPVSRKCIN